MKTADHLFLGKALSDKYMKSCSVLSKKAFILGNIFPCIFNLWSLPAIAEEWKSAVLISGLLYGSGTSCCRLWKFAGGTSKCNRRHKRSVKKKKSRKQKKA